MLPLRNEIWRGMLRKKYQLKSRSDDTIIAVLATTSLQHFLISVFSLTGLLKYNKMLLLGTASNIKL
jgi:hypothetical protein